MGRLYVAASDNALTGIWYEEQAHFPLPHELGERITDPAGLVAEADEVAQAIGADAERRGEHIYVAPARILAQTERELDEYFRGRRTDFEVPLDPDGTDFQLAVWDYLKTVPYGYTVTYGEISRMVGPGAPAQAVGQAVGHNKIAIIIPCHRVLGAGGKLTGYAGGLDRKRWLLDREEPKDIRSGRLF
uniref:methylated-DNA--[protein]-cysteine S-methyltransferase n=1 Tax=Rothia sp. HSID18067 TaxID=2419514 RepID=UPI001EE8BFE3|nr:MULTISPECIES: methylated-DNA--[protein]-cysteine S-methyltransferase [Rothia]